MFLRLQWLSNLYKTALYIAVTQILQPSHWLPKIFSCLICLYLKETICQKTAQECKSPHPVDVWHCTHLPTGSFARQTYRPPRQPEACEPFFYKNCLDASYQVCIAKCLPEIDDLPKNVYKITVQECKSPHPVDMWHCTHLPTESFARQTYRPSFTAFNFQSFHFRQSF